MWTTALILLGGALSQVNLVAETDLQLQDIADQSCQQVVLKEFNLPRIGESRLNLLIYFRVLNTLSDAQDVGVPLELNSTFRTCAEQEALRLNNCPSVEVGAEFCHPETEKPGESLHNYGLAVDFKCSGYLVFGSSPCYTWLVNNAQAYDLINRPSEPWHWSLTGK